jgi:hypothetical protein
MAPLRKLAAVGLALVLAAGPGIAAVGSWNGVAFTALNGVAQTGWNGTAISCASSGPTAVTIDAFARNYQNGSGTHTFSYAQGSLTTGYIVVMPACLLNAATGITSVTYGGTTMTKLDESTSGGRYCAIFGVAVGTSASGSKTVVITWNGSVYETNSVTVSMTGASQSATPAGTNGNGFSGTPSLNSATTTTNDMVFATFTSDSIGTGLTSGNTTLDISDGAFNVFGNSRAVGTGAAVAMSWTMDAPHGYVTATAVVTH